MQARTLSEAIARAEKNANDKNNPYNVPLNVTYHVNKPSNVHEMSCHVSKREYAKIIELLESWNVFYPKTLIYKHSIQKIKKAIEKTLQDAPQCNGKYFRYILTQKI